MMGDQICGRDNCGPFAGVRVLDLTSVVFGPYATQILGDFGADVIKVEGPKRGERGEGGDTMRYSGETPVEGLGPIFMNLNRNKRSICLDLARGEDRQLLDHLIRETDVFVSNIRMDGLRRLGLDYENVACVRPDIIYAHAAGYDSSGPDASLPAYDDLIQARAGMADIATRRGLGEEPRYEPSIIADKVCGLFLAQAIMAALFHREKTGEGQAIEVPMLETFTSFLLIEHSSAQTFVPPVGDWGYRRVLSQHRRPYPTKDGYIAILPYSTEQWEVIFAFLGRKGAILEDLRYNTDSARSSNIEHLYELLATLSPTRTTAEWVELLKELKVPHSRVQTLDELRSDPQLQAVNLFQQREHMLAGPYIAMRPPVKFSKSPASIRRDPPGLGEHSAEIAAETGRCPGSAKSERS